MECYASLATCRRDLRFIFREKQSVANFNFEFVNAKLSFNAIFHFIAKSCFQQ